MGKRKDKAKRAAQAEPGVTMFAPAFTSRTIELSESADGATFRKKILPLATITYPRTRNHPGGPVTFDRGYHQDLIDAFRGGAYDNPTLQLASGGVEHNADVKLTAGSIIDLSHEQPDDVDGPGLYATVRAHSPEDAAIFRKNPKLGVSPEIVEGRTDVQGRHFKAAVHHVLATLKGRVAGLGEWRTVSLSSTDGPVIDLSAAEYEEIQPMGKKRREAEQVLSLSEDEIEAALEAAAAQFGDVVDDEPTLRRLALSDSGPQFGDDVEYGSTVVQLSEAWQDTRTELTGVRAQLQYAQWEKDRAAYSAAGVPKRILDLAEDVLGYPGATVLSLSDDEGETSTVDARDVIRDMVEQCRGIIDLSDPAGSSAEPTAQQAGAVNVDGMLSAWESRSGS